jgi:type II secretory pathway pseudopilin PulG
MLARRRKPTSGARNALSGQSTPPHGRRPAWLRLPARLPAALDPLPHGWRTLGDLPRAWRTLGEESGLSLIEVTISALLVGVIAVGVLTGFETAASTANDNRLHDEANLLASESQEELRTDPSSVLTRLVSSPRSYKRTVGKEGFTVVQETKFNKQPNDAGCGSTAGTKSSDEPSETYEIRSRVTWTLNKRAEIEQSSIITPPEGSGLDVEVSNGGIGKEMIPVAGATVEADGITTTTSREGCAIYTGISVTTVSVTASKVGYMTPSGASQFKQESVTIAPNIITRVPVTLGQAGAITASFSYGGKAIEGDTFVAENSEMKTSTNYVLAGTNGSYSASVASGYELFPFASSKSWQVYAGDCPADNPASVSGGKLKPTEVAVLGGQAVPATVHMAYVKLEVYTGTSSKQETLDNTTEYPVKITNSGCSKSIPSNKTATNVISEQKTAKTGVLQHPYQPFGSYTLCLYSSTEKKIYSTTYENTAEAEKAIKIDLKGTTGSAGTNITVTSNESSNKC